MLLRPRCHGHQNVILCHVGCAPSGIFLQVYQRDTEAYLHSKYPGVTNIIYLPPSFSNVVNYLRVDFDNGTFGRSHYHVLLNKEITSYFLNLSGVRFDSLGSDLFPTEDSVEDFCLNFVIEEYIKVTLELLRGGRARRNYLNKLTAAKEQWMIRRQLRLNQERYLGGNSFDVEIKRSCAEFYTEVRKVLGSCPIRWHSIN